jgi:RNA polymerase sigma factor (sigma-70 family)
MMNDDEARESEAEERRIAAARRAGRAAIQAAHAAALFEAHADWLRRYVRRLTDNRSLPPSWLDPDDVVQDAFVQLLRHDWAEPIRNPGAWLCVVVRNQVAKAAQQHRHFIDDDPGAHIEGGTAGWSSVPRQASTEEIVAARATVDAIARLAGNQQVATYLSRVQGWPHADIAAFLGCSTSAAGVHVFRGTHVVSVSGDVSWGWTVARQEGILYAESGLVDALHRRARRLAVVVQVALASVTVILFISGVAWWVAVVPVIAPTGAILVIMALAWGIEAVLRLGLVFMRWLDNRASSRKADSGS